MRELEYPFDAGYILKKRRKLRKELLQSDADFLEKNVAILGGSTTYDIRETLELFLLNYGIRPSFYESGYNCYYEDAVFPNPELEAFQPDVIYIHTTNRNVDQYPTLRDTSETVETLLETQFNKFTKIWTSLAERYHCPVIQNNFEMPSYRLLGNKDASDIHGAVNFLTRLNMRFYQYAQAHDNFFLCDINYISADYGLKEWSDSLSYYLYKYALNVQAIPCLSFNVANIIKSLFGKNKKGFVLDLDNTLWGGVIGDDGLEKIKIGRDTPGGLVYTEFQQYLKACQQMGVLLSIDSKNDMENALAGLEHPDSELRPDDFVQIKANWQPKDANFLEIASSLNVLPESLVFVDDNPAERHIVTERLRGVSAPEIGESHQYIRRLDRSGFFETTTLSEDDLTRNRMYRQNAERTAFQASCADYGAYLSSLQMRARIRPFDSVYMERIAQLTNKTNQFNLTTRRYAQTELENIAQNPDFLTFYAKLTDRFGDNGVVSILIGRIQESVCHIDLWLMSCRVLKRDLELAVMDALVRQCQKKGVSEIRGSYRPTSKNAMVKDFYGSLGFEKMEEQSNGETLWRYLLPDRYVPMNQYIKLEDDYE